MGVGMKMKKVVIFPLKRCYRAICNHLLLVGFLFFLAFLYRSSPFIFSMLVTASPVVVCTLVLLGALLSYGKPNVDEIEVDNREAQELVLLKAAFSDDSIVGKKENVSVEKSSDKGKDIEEKLTKRASAIENDNRTGGDGSPGKSVETTSQDREADGPVQENNKKRLRALHLKNQSRTLEERLTGRRFEDTKYSLLVEDNIDDDEHLDQENDGSLVDEEEGDEYDGDEALDSGSDGAESSSQNSLMSDITPIVDELHPLLDEGVSQPDNSSHDSSDAYSELSVTSNESSSEVDDDTDEDEELKVAENDDKEELNEDKEDHTKCTITWTEEDQKNLMDLGTSELERNRRLENLIARRRARRCMTTVTEKNLIDLDGSDPPFPVPPILTTRANPFDSPHDSGGNMGHPPIPGSAPSILLPLRNPFDIPYDSRQEKPGPMEGNYQQEFMPSQPKDQFFRRHDGSNVQPSCSYQQEFMPPKPKDPYFRRHESFNVQPSCSYQGEFMTHQPKDPFFRRHGSFNVQASSGYQEEFVPLQPKDPFFRRHESFNVQPASFGINRTENQVMNRYRPYFVSERLGSNGTSYAPIHRQSSEVSDSKASSGPDTESVSSTVDMEESDDTDEESYIDAEDDISREPELISKIDNAPELVGHGSESTEEDEDSLELGQVEKKQIKVDEIDMKLEDVQSYDGISHSSSLPGESGSIKIATSLTDDTKPVYDSSPSAALENRSLSSSNTDPHVDLQLDLSAMMAKRSVSFSDRVTKLGSRYVDIDAIVDKDILSYSSAGEKLSNSAVKSIVTENVPDNASVIEKSLTESSVKDIHVDEELGPLEKSGQKASHNYHQGAFEPSVDFQEHDPDVSNVKRDLVSVAASHAGVTNEDRSPVGSPHEVDIFEDVGSDKEEYDMNKTMRVSHAEVANEDKSPVDSPHEVDNFEDAGSDRDESDVTETVHVSHVGVTNEDRSPVDNLHEIDTFEDAGSDRGESDVKETTHASHAGVTNEYISRVDSPHEVDTFKDAGSDREESDVKVTMHVSHAGVTNEDRSPINNPNEVDTFEDAGSEREESDGKLTIHVSRAGVANEYKSPVDSPREVDTFEDVGSDREESNVKETMHVSHAGVTNEDRSPVDSPNDVDTFEDAGSERGEPDVKETMQIVGEDTGFEVKTPDFSDASERDISNKNEQSSNRSSSYYSAGSGSGSGFGSYASMSDSDRD